MPPPKLLMKKNRTFDCDLTDMDRQRLKPTNETPPPPPPLPTHCAQSSNNAPSGSNASTTTTTTPTTIANRNLCQNHHDFIGGQNYDTVIANCPNDKFDNSPNAPNSVTANNQLPNENVAHHQIGATTSGQKLSKLVLSSSLHQLADSKYHNIKHHHPTCQSNTNAYHQQTPNKLTSNMNDEINSNAATTMLHNSTTATQLYNSNTSGGTQSTIDDQQQKQRTMKSFAGNKNNPKHKPTHNDATNNIQTHQHNIITETKNAKISPNNSNSNSNANPNTTTTTNYNYNSSHKKREANLDTVHVVVGNESCDLDSAVSCLLMFHIISKMSDEINGKDKTRTLYIPLLNTTRDMLDSKCEVLWFLQKTLNIDKSFLTCKDDIDWNEIKKNGVEVLVTLVDHNYNEEFKDIGKIVEIIDHHQVQNSQWLMENQSQIRLTLDTQVGSCTTLIAERLFYIYAEHHVSDEILLLIYGTVLLDTICLSEKAKRFTRRDVYLLRKLDSLLGSKRPVREALYKQLVEVKNSTRELNFEKLMKRDLKIFKDKHGMRVGIASLFGMAAREALGLAANIDLDLFFRQNQYEAFIIMGLIADLEHSDSISRDLVLISSNRSLFVKLCQAFENDTSKLDLQPIGSDSSPDPEDNIINNRKIVDSSSDLTKATESKGNDDSQQPDEQTHQPYYKARIWLQRNVTSSRKVVAPLVLKVLHDGAQ